MLHITKKIFKKHVLKRLYAKLKTRVTVQKLNSFNRELGLAIYSTALQRPIRLLVN